MGLARKTIFISRGSLSEALLPNEEFIMAKKVQAYVKLQVAAGM